MKNLFAPFAILAAIMMQIFPAMAQTQAQEKVDEALRGFLQTPFMTRFQDMRSEAEATVRSFKQEQNRYRPQDVARVQVAYDQTARRFNMVLENIKSDFLNSEKMKFIAKFPETYSQGMELELYRLSDFYAQNFQQALSDVTGSSVDGSPLVLILAELIGLTKGLVGHLNELKRQSRLYTEASLNRFLVQPYRFPSWQEIQVDGSYTPQSTYNDPYNTGNTGGYNQQPYNTNTGGYNQPYTDPNNTGNTGGYNQQPYTDPYNTGNTGGYNQQPYNTNNGGYNQPYTDPYNTGNNGSNYNTQQPYNNTGGYNQQQQPYNNGGYTQQPANPNYPSSNLYGNAADSTLQDNGPVVYPPPPAKGQQQPAPPVNTGKTKNKQHQEQ